MPIRTLFLNRDLYYHGGVCQSFLTFARFHDSTRIALEIASFMPPSPEVATELKDLPIRLYEIGDSYLAAIWKVRELVKAQRIQVIVCGTYKAFVVAQIAAVSTNCRVIFWIPAIPFMVGNIKRWSFRFLALHSRLVFISKAVASAHAYAWHRGRTSIVYYGLSETNVERVPPSIRELIGVADGAAVLGFVAEFTRWKDHETAIDAIRLLSDQDSDVHLILIGTGHDLERIRSYTAESNLLHRVHFLGARSDVRALYPQFDLYIHPAVGEGFGLAVAEAMLAARAVIAADAGALPEFIIDGQTGILFTPHDARELSRNIASLLEDPARRKALGEQGRAYCLAHFDTGRFAGEMTTLIEEESVRPRWSLTLSPFRRRRWERAAGYQDDPQ